MQKHWIRYTHAGSNGFGTLEGDDIHVYEGEMFGRCFDSGMRVWLSQVQLAMPCRPTKVIALWNNFHALGEKLQLPVPAEPLYLVKSPNSYLAPGATIRKPKAEGKVVFEGELGIVIGKTCSAVTVDEALDHVFGYTCANDVTHAEILNRDASFTQWTRAKSFDTFCPFGPVIASGLDAATLRVRTRLDGELRQDYPISDMRFPVAELVSRLSADMTLAPGDLILCGTSVGVGSMKPGSQVEVSIDGIGTLTNRFE